jgi:hypothetical protein
MTLASARKSFRINELADVHVFWTHAHLERLSPNFRRKKSQTFCFQQFAAVFHRLPVREKRRFQWQTSQRSTQGERIGIT